MKTALEIAKELLETEKMFGPHGEIKEIVTLAEAVVKLESRDWYHEYKKQSQALKEAEKFVRYSKNTYAGMNASEHVKEAEDWLAKYGSER